MKYLLIACLLILAFAESANAKNVSATQEQMKACDAENRAHPVPAGQYRQFIKSCGDRKSIVPKTGMTPSAAKIKMDDCAREANNLSVAARRAYIKKCFDGAPAH